MFSKQGGFVPDERSVFLGLGILVSYRNFITDSRKGFVYIIFVGQREITEPNRMDCCGGF
jgi:hypothetical protein